MKSMGRFLVLAFLPGLVCGCGGAPAKRLPILDTVASGTTETRAGLPVLYLHGSYYAMGYQHGSLMRSRIRASVADALKFADRQGKLPLVGSWMARNKLDAAWAAMRPHIPDSYLEEMQGLADGAAVPLKLIQRMHVIADLAPVRGSFFVAGVSGSDATRRLGALAAGSMTPDGKLVQAHNLESGIQSDGVKNAAIFVCHPKGRTPFVGFGWLGFAGVVSGVNRNGLSASVIGAESSEESLDGVPVPFLVRRVLEESADLETAVSFVRQGPRTVGYHYLFTDAKTGRAVALETTRQQCAVFYLDKERPSSPYELSVSGALFRSEFALDPFVRGKQTACGGNPEKPGLESPIGSDGYAIRYAGLAGLLKRFSGRLTPETAMAVASAVTAPVNSQSVVTAYPQAWVSVRGKSQSGYRSLDMERLFAQLASAEKG